MTTFSKKILAVAITSAIMVPTAQACTAVAVGKNASASGALIIARNEDFSINNWAKHMVVHPRQTIEDGTVWTLSNGLKVPAPKVAYRYTSIADWDAYQHSNDGKVFEERGVNEYNVAMSSTTSAEVNDKAKAVDPLVDTGIIEEVMPTLILPQAKSAREAVQLLGHYVEQYGAGEGNGIQFSDKDEIWYMEIGSGHHWMAVRVPDDQYLIMANGLRIHGVDLNDKQNVMASRGVYDFVKKHNLLKNPDQKSFNFAKAFGVINDPYNIDREWLGQQLLTPSVKQKPRQAQYPLFMKPDEKISVLDVANVLRADYKGTALEGKSERPIGIDRQAESHIIEMYPDMPKELSAVIWQTVGTVEDTAFVPTFNAMDEIPPAYTVGTDQYDDQSAWWTYRSLGTLTNKHVMDGKYAPVVRSVWDQVEGQYVNSQPYINSMLKTMYKQDPAMAIQFANDYSNGLLSRTLDKARTLKSQLMTDLTRSTEKKYSPEEFEKIKNL